MCVNMLSENDVNATNLMSHMKQNAEGGSRVNAKMESSTVVCNIFVLISKLGDSSCTQCFRREWYCVCVIGA